MTIREATHDDIPRIVEMSAKFYSQTRYVDIAPMAKESAAGLAIVMMDQGVMLLAEAGGAVVGMVGLFIEPFTFNIEKTMATELVWWVDPEHQRSGIGAELLASIEPACRARGANIIRMMCLAGQCEAAEAIYSRMGYTPSEHAYTKVI
jgi:GNAT superfamily N-acetyltransferase